MSQKFEDDVQHDTRSIDYMQVGGAHYLFMSIAGAKRGAGVLQFRRRRNTQATFERLHSIQDSPSSGVVVFREGANRYMLPIVAVGDGAGSQEALKWTDTYTPQQSKDHSLTDVYKWTYYRTKSVFTHHSRLYHINPERRGCCWIFIRVEGRGLLVVPYETSTEIFQWLPGQERFRARVQIIEGAGAPAHFTTNGMHYLVVAGNMYQWFGLQFALVTQSPLPELLLPAGSGSGSPFHTNVFITPFHVNGVTYLGVVRSGSQHATIYSFKHSSEVCLAVLAASSADATARWWWWLLFLVVWTVAVSVGTSVMCPHFSKHYVMHFRKKTIINAKANV